MIIELLTDCVMLIQMIFLFRNYHNHRLDNLKLLTFLTALIVIGLGLQWPDATILMKVGLFLQIALLVMFIYDLLDNMCSR